MSGIFSRSPLVPTIAFFCLEHVFDKSLDLCVDFHVPAFTNGVKTDNLLIFSLIYSSPEMMETLIKIQLMSLFLPVATPLLDNETNYPIYIVHEHSGMDSVIGLN